MCDDTTEAENAAYLERLRLSRRQAGMGAGATLAALWTGCTKHPAPPEQGATSQAASQPAAPSTVPATSVTPPATTTRKVTIETPDGKAEGFFVAPKSSKHPGVLMWPDIAGLREAYETMATRLAGAGYAVLAVNQYYRSTKLPVFATFAEFQTEQGRAKVGPLKAAITPEGIAKDAAAFVAWLDQQPEVDQGKKLASSGYCMTGSYTLRTAAAVPARLGAVASFHGAGLATTDPTSPHLLFDKMKAAALICIAQGDDQREPETKTTLRKAADAAKIQAEIEVYPAQHGWCTLDAPVYDQAQAERAWARMLATFERSL